MAAEVYEIRFDHPADWEVHLGARGPATTFVMSDAASLNCPGGDVVNECSPSLQPGGVLAWWALEANRVPLQAGQAMAVDGREARLYIGADACDRVGPSGGGVLRRELSVATRLVILDGETRHVVSGCFRNPGASENFKMFLDFLSSVDLPERPAADQ